LCLTVVSSAGAGKTTLVSRVIDHFLDHHRDQGIAYFYCNRNEATRREPKNIMRSFVKQLSISPDNDAIQTALVRIYRQKEDKGFASNELTFEESRDMLLELVQTYSRTVMVLDALDETLVDRGLRIKLINAFNDLIQGSQKLKIFISSRRDDDIRFQLEKKSNIGIEATDNQDDISKYVMEKINQARALRHTPISEDLQGQIVQTLLQKSQGM
jgi:Cdc6-like AAA superfamily ATPase